MHSRIPWDEARGEWTDHLTAGQLAFARTLQAAGLTGRPTDASGFAWWKDGEEVVRSEHQQDVGAAFDDTVRRMPAEFLGLTR